MTDDFTNMEQCETCRFPLNIIEGHRCLCDIPQEHHQQYWNLLETKVGILRRHAAFGKIGEKLTEFLSGGGKRVGRIARKTVRAAKPHIKRAVVASAEALVDELFGDNKKKHHRKTLNVKPIKLKNRVRCIKCRKWVKNLNKHRCGE